jgi:hypothetical protein
MYFDVAGIGTSLVPEEGPERGHSATNNVNIGLVHRFQALGKEVFVVEMVFTTQTQSISNSRIMHHWQGNGTCDHSQKCWCSYFMAVHGHGHVHALKKVCISIQTGW